MGLGSQDVVFASWGCAALDECNDAVYTLVVEQGEFVGCAMTRVRVAPSPEPCFVVFMEQESGFTRVPDRLGGGSSGGGGSSSNPVVYTRAGLVEKSELSVQVGFLNEASEETSTAGVVVWTLSDHTTGTRSFKGKGAPYTLTTTVPEGRLPDSVFWMEVGLEGDGQPREKVHFRRQEGDPEFLAIAAKTLRCAQPQTLVVTLMV